YLADWLANTAYAANAFILPSALNNNAGGFIFQNQGLAGTSGATAPAFPQTPGQMVADNTVTWLNVGLSNTGGSIISSHDHSSSDSTAQALTVNTQTVTLDAVTDGKTYDATQVSSGLPTVRGGTGPLFPGDVGMQIFSSKDVLGVNGSTLTATMTVKNGVTDVSSDYTVTVGNTANGTITPKTLVVSGLSVSDKTYDATLTATLTGTASLLTAETGGTGTTSDGKPYTGDIVSLTSTAASAFTGTFASKDVASGIAVAVTGNTLSGAQEADYVLSSTNE